MEKNFSVFWEIVPGDMCNLKCLGCYAAGGARPDKRVLEENELKLLVSRIVDLGCDKVDMLGGEPLIHRNLPFIVQYFKKRNPKGFFGIVTNGLLLNYERAYKLKKAGLDQITFSFDGVTDKVNDANRGKGSFEKTLRGVKNAKRVGLNFTISFTINRFNLSQSSLFIPFAENIGANSVGIQIIEKSGRANKFWNKISITREEGLVAICKMFERRPNIFVAINSRTKFKQFLNKFWNAGLELKDERCMGGISSLMISSGGDIFPCSLYAYQKGKEVKNLVYDNFLEIKNFLDTKYLKFNQAIRKQAAKKFVTCRKCEFSNLLCNPCPLANKSKAVKECEWVIRQKGLLQDKILKSKLKCLIRPKIVSNDKLMFYVKTQDKPLFLKISLFEFNKFFQAKNVEDIIDWFKETNATEEIVKFVCQLHSHGIIEIEKFRSLFLIKQ